MIKRFFAIGFIFACVSVAWMILAGVTYNRTNSADASLKSQVAQLWGAPQVQMPPQISAFEIMIKKVESLEEGKKIVKTVEEKITENLHSTAVRFRWHSSSIHDKRGCFGTPLTAWILARLMW